MDVEELTGLLAGANDARRERLLRQHAALAGRELADALRARYLALSGSDPQGALSAAAVLTILAQRTGDAYIRAVADWTEGLAELQVNGKPERAAACIDRAFAGFTALGDAHTAALTQVGRVYALALLGRYDEAIDAGLRARDALLAHGDQAAAGRIEHNLGNIEFRRDRYREAEQLYRAAFDRFGALQDQKQLALVGNCLANALNQQHRFGGADALYQEALARAQETGLSVTCAEIERNLGSAALLQGRYGRALDYLERARRRYAALGMAHRSAGADQELADAYLELNLVPEAAAIYERVIPTFASLGLRAEEAAARAQHGRALSAIGQANAARVALAEAGALYHAEANRVGEAGVTLAGARLDFAAGDCTAAAAAAEHAEVALVAAGAWRPALLARWLRGEALRRLGRFPEARALLTATLRDAERWQAPQVLPRCHTSLGLIAEAEREFPAAEASFTQAIALIEDLRAPLPAEEFRSAFLADNLLPYQEMVRLCLRDGSGRVAEALRFVEQARSRALVEMLGGALEVRPRARDPFEAALVRRLDDLRGELNRLYGALNREAAVEAVIERLRAEVAEREGAVAAIMLQLQQRGGGDALGGDQLDLGALQRALGDGTTLVEYHALDGALIAFVVTGGSVEAVRLAATEAQVETAIQQFHFQLGTLRYGAARLGPHADALSARARHHLAALYDLLLRPITGRLRGERLGIVPHRAMHYLPFQALYDGAAHLVERFEVFHAPSAGALLRCLAHPPRPIARACLLGVPDEQIPRVTDEVATLSALFPEAVALVGERATIGALHTYTGGADVLHLACHGQFRHDNPSFSALHLADGWLTVRDAYALELSCQLIVLSACETGVSAVAPGDELIGLTRGFFAAGAPSLLVSLWTVDDDSTAALMTTFYQRIRAGDRPAAALRHAQRTLLARSAHPFYWAPFVLVGRW